MPVAPKPGVKGPLSGYRIIEFGAYFTLPLAAMWLADQGADVIKVEPPSGDLVRFAYTTRKGAESMSAGFMNLNRNKRGLMLDIKQPGAVDAFKKLVETSDVVMQNFRPGVMERFGLGYEDLKKIKKDIIFVSVSGFGTEGPYSKQRVFDHVIQAASGLTVAQFNRERGDPDMVKTALADKITSHVIFQAITAALLYRANTGEGQHIEINMLNSMLSFLWSDTAANYSLMGGEDLNVVPPTTDMRCIYKTSDGYILTSGVNNSDWAALCSVIGKPQLAEDPRFNSAAMRMTHLKETYEELKDCFRDKTSAEWLTILRNHDVVCGPVNSLEEIHNDPQVQALGLLVETEHPHAGPYRQPIHPAYFEKSPADIRRHAPMLGEQSEEVLREAGYGDAEIAQLKKNGAI